MEAPPEIPAEPAAPAPSAGSSSAPRLLGAGRTSDRLGGWSLYFVAKLVLVWKGLIGFHAVENIVLLAVLAGPLASPRWRRWRPWFAVPAAVALLYHDSWLPRISRVVSQAGLLSGFSADYLAELAGRFVAVPVLAALAAAAALYFIVARFVRADVFVAAALLALAFVPASPAPGAATAREAGPGGAAREAADDPETLLGKFYAGQAQRGVAFHGPPEASAPFDVIFIHVCSLSWDDLAATGLSKHPLLSRFDFILRRFNSVSTYSGPSAIRILRAACGQTPHRALYSPAPDRCLLMPALERAGFATQLVLNHDGHFDDFLAFVRSQGLPRDPLPLDGLPAPQRSFDQSRIHDDRAVLLRWMEARRGTGAPRVAMYYNTVSLHDGNRLAADAKKASGETYPARLAKLLDDLDAFLGKLEGSGRRAVVVMVPEHGAAVRGDAMQIAGLREIPSPAITLVPVGIRVVGPGAHRLGEPLQIGESTSYLALSHLVSRLVEKPPFGAEGFRPADYAAGLPVTGFVAENETATVLQRGDRYFLRQYAEPWQEYHPAPGR